MLWASGPEIKIILSYVINNIMPAHMLKRIMGTLVKNVIYLAYHKCYTLIVLHASRGLSKLHNKQRWNDLYGEDNASRCRCAPIPL